jgi:hypothetical protein
MIRHSNQLYNFKKLYISGQIILTGNELIGEIKGKEVV